MNPDSWSLYGQMLKSRLFEETVTQLWQDGLISGEMHLGIGEEAIVAGVVDHVRDGDAMALDHRGTSALLMRGLDPVTLLREFLGRSTGLCSGQGGHMHLFSRDHLVASSGIVGASAPAAVGFALSATHLRPGAMAIAFFGEGAMNQGMVLEAMNLAVVWELPVLFVCKDNDWAITTRSRSVIGGKLVERAQSFGMPAVEIDGSDVLAVWQAAHKAMERARAGAGPSFLQAHCVHREGHLLGDPLLRIVRHPVREMARMAGPMLRSVLRRKGAPLRERIGGLRVIVGLILKAFDEHSSREKDPVGRARQKLEAEPERLQELEQGVVAEVERVAEMALATS